MNQEPSENRDSRGDRPVALRQGWQRVAAAKSADVTYRGFAIFHCNQVGRNERASPLDGRITPPLRGIPTPHRTQAP